MSQRFSDTTAPAYVQIRDGWAELVLNRPERKNAIVGPMGEALAACLDYLAQQDEVRVILLRGAGDAFCSGLDLKAFNADPEPLWLADFQQTWRRAHRALFDINKPVIGVLQRYAINGGAALALACDLLLVGRTAYLQVGEVQIGMAAPYNLAWMSLRHSEAVMSRIALLGERITGVDLVEMGLAQFCVEDDELLHRGHALATQLAGFEGHGLRRIKAGLRAGLGVTADQWFDQFTQADPTAAKPKPKATPG